jgi:CheY-like chemotaxis protein
METAQTKTSQTDYRGRVRRAIVIDDDDAVRNLVVRILDDRLKYEVDCYASPRSAYERFQLTRENPAYYCIAITDLTMPEMDGLELSRRVQEIIPGLPFILMTGNSNGVDQSQFPGNIKAVLFKPFGMHELIELVQKHAAHR